MGSLIPNQVRYRQSKKKKQVLNMFWNCISTPNYTKLQCKDEKCEKDNCDDCLVKELLKENWQDNTEHVFLKIAYEKQIIQNIATSIGDLNKEDKKTLERINFL